MAIKVTKNIGEAKQAKKSSGSSELTEVLAQIKKNHGESIGGKGVKPSNPPRIATGVFPLDLATGGGFLRGRINIVYGAESSGKTNLGLLACARVQKTCGVCYHLHEQCTCEGGYTKQVAVFVDIENAFDSDWAARMGVDTDELILLQPDYAEQAVDLVESVIYANDVGIVIADSIAALVTRNEVEKGAETAAVGGASALVGKLIRKTSSALSSERKRNHLPAVILINQIRHKIGVMFGDPETTPGGNAPRFASSLTVRVYGKNEMVKEISPVMPTYKDVSCILKKWKCQVVAINFEFKMAMIAHKGLEVGEVESWNTAAAYLRSQGKLVKNEKGTKYLCLGEEYDKLGDLTARYKDDETFREVVQKSIIATEMDIHSVAESVE